MWFNQSSLYNGLPLYMARGGGSSFYYIKYGHASRFSFLCKDNIENIRETRRTVYESCPLHIVRTDPVTALPAGCH